MKFIIENYLIIILVGLFFAFALIGYLVDMLRKTDSKESNMVINDNISPVEISNIEKNNNDDLLNSGVEDNIENKM